MSDTPRTTDDTIHLAQTIAQELGETDQAVIHKIMRIIELLGVAFTQEILQETRQVEAQGGLMVLDKSRRRTPGGVFFYLTRQRLKQEKRLADLEELFPRQPRTAPSLQEATPPPPPPPPRMRPRRRRQGQEPDETETPAPPRRSNQAHVLTLLERHIGNPPDLYRRSINQETGELRLSFHFPAIAQQRYGDAIAAAAAEAHTPITIAPHPHQDALNETIRQVIPEGLTLAKASVYQEPGLVRVRCRGEAPIESIQAAMQAFQERTGWNLEIHQIGQPPLMPPPDAPGPQGILPQQQAISLARYLFGEESGLSKVSVMQEEHRMVLRFPFPDVARDRYAEQIAALQERTGWQVTVYPQVNQSELVALVQRLLPEHLSMMGRPALYPQERTIVVRYRGTLDQSVQVAAQQEVALTTGWKLELQALDSPND